MNIIEQLKVRRNHLGRRRYLEEKFSDMMLSDHIEQRELDNSFASEYKLTCDIGIIFCANSAQYDEALLHAKQMILHNIYSNVHVHLNHAVAALYSGDRNEALNILHELRKEIAG